MQHHTAARWLTTAILGVITVIQVPAHLAAQPPQGFAGEATRYMALGDSLAAGFKAQPVTQGYAYLLYQSGVFDRVPQTLFNNAAVVGATSEDVLLHQVSQALIPAAEGGFRAGFVTISVGGNDLAAVLRFAATNPTPLELQTFAGQALTGYAQNVTAILQQLSAGLPGVRIFVANQYAVPEIEMAFPGGDLLLDAFNTTLAGVLAGFPNAHLVDVHGAFLDRHGLLLIERRGAGAFEVHLTNAGHRVMAQAFSEAITGS